MYAYKDAYGENGGVGAQLNMHDQNYIAYLSEGLPTLEQREWLEALGSIVWDYRFTQDQNKVPGDLRERMRMTLEASKLDDQSAHRFIREEHEYTERYHARIATITLLHQTPVPEGIRLEAEGEFAYNWFMSYPLEELIAILESNIELTTQICKEIRDRFET